THHCLSRLFPSRPLSPLWFCVQLGAAVDAETLTSSAALQQSLLAWVGLDSSASCPVVNAQYWRGRA
uniref:Uncharacterized protein n=1 Tax=Electrophorus electricus TaxID=8005 RepID=A0AAY5EDM7_ELEEL